MLLAKHEWYFSWLKSTLAVTCLELICVVTAATSPSHAAEGYILLRYMSRLLHSYPAVSITSSVISPHVTVNTTWRKLNLWSVSDAFNPIISPISQHYILCYLYIIIITLSTVFFLLSLRWRSVVLVTTSSTLLMPVLVMLIYNYCIHSCGCEHASS